MHYSKVRSDGTGFGKRLTTILALDQKGCCVVQNVAIALCVVINGVLAGTLHKAGPPGSRGNNKALPRPKVLQRVRQPAEVNAQLMKP